MRLIHFAILAVVAISLGGCKATGPDNALDIEAKKMAQPAYQEYAAAPNATEWMMDMRHTLRGVGIEEASTLCQDLLRLGATELKAGDIKPDPNDASFQSAGKLFVKLPRDTKQRAELLTFIGRLNGLEKPIPDTAQDFEVVLFQR